MNKSIFSKIILEHLYNQRTYNSQYFNGAGIPESIMQLGESKGFNFDRTKDEKLFRETFWELASKNLVVQGSNAADDNLPFVSITAYGIKCYEAGKILPYDPEGFLTSLNQKIPNLDTIIKLYFEEAVSCFSNMQYLPSTVMIGGALERAIIYLTEQFNDKLDTSLQPQYNKQVLKVHKIKTKFDNFLSFIKTNTLDKSLKQAAKEKLHSTLPSIVHLIRITRNETGHPTGREVDRDEAQGNLLLAKEAIIFTYDLLKEMP